jgi:hypothetical protein
MRKIMQYELKINTISIHLFIKFINSELNNKVLIIKIFNLDLICE